MRAPRLEVADVVRSCQDEFQARYSTSLEQRRALPDSALCRTAALGGHLRKCNPCGHQEISYHSCLNRHCPKCQAKKQADWLQQRSQDLLEVPYFHVVFTLPEPLGPLALQNPRLLYALLFRAAAETLLRLARDEKHRGAEIGFLAILPTGGQNLLHHPHLHCVVPGGGIAPDQGRWIACRKNFFLPVRVLSRLFKKKFLGGLRKAYRQNQLSWQGPLEPLGAPRPWSNWLRRLEQTEWVVYCKPPFGSPQQVLKYLARYTHRVAISNRRLLSFHQGRVTFHYQDYRQVNPQRLMTLPTLEFIRRFLLHVLPHGFVRIRHYGFLAHRSRKDKRLVCRRLLQHPAPEPSDRDSLHAAPSSRQNLFPCPACQKGQRVVVDTLAPRRCWMEPRMNSPGHHESL